MTETITLSLPLILAETDPQRLRAWRDDLLFTKGPLGDTTPATLSSNELQMALALTQRISYLEENGQIVD